MENKDLGDTEEKFFFNVNVFDDDHEEEEEDLPPPPPMFSESELEAAKKAAFAEGQAQARQEEQQSREQAVSKTLAQITNQTSTLFATELEREKRYEHEAVHLTLRIFKDLFPLYNQSCGFAELERALKDTLDKHRQTKSIEVFVAPELGEHIQKSLDTLSGQNTALSFNVQEDSALTGHACRLQWADGGATHDPDKMATEIETILKQTLADDGFTGHDKEILDAKQTDEEKNDSIQDDTAGSQDDASPDPTIMETPDE